MTKAFINADLLSKTRPIPPFLQFSFSIKNRVCTRTLASESFPWLICLSRKRHSVAITTYLLRHLFKIKIHISVLTFKQELKVCTNTQYPPSYITAL